MVSRNYCPQNFASTYWWQFWNNEFSSIRNSLFRMTNLNITNRQVLWVTMTVEKFSFHLYISYILSFSYSGLDTSTLLFSRLFSHQHHDELIIIIHWNWRTEDTYTLLNETSSSLAIKSEIEFITAWKNRDVRT